MKYFVLIVTLLFVSVAYAAFPQPVGFVNDYANILPDRASLESSLQQYEKNTTIEIAVVTLDSLPQDQTAATYAVELFQHWGIGKKGEDNGVLVLIIKNGTIGNRLRIELGYGIQGYITGAEAGRILDAALPYYEAGDYNGAAFLIVNELKEQLKDYVPGSSGHSGQPDFFEFSLLFSTFTLGISTIALFAFMKNAPSDKSKKALKIAVATMPVLWVLSLLSPIAMAVIFFSVILSILIAATYFMRPRCPRCKSMSIQYTYSSNSPVVRCECKKCHKVWKKRQPGYYRGGVFVAAGGFGGGMGGGGGFGGGGSGGGGAGR